MRITQSALILLALSVLGCAGQGGAQDLANNKSYNMTSILPRGNEAPKGNFTGQVWMNQVVKLEDNLNSIIAQVTFAPQARTNWHLHPHGQVLIVTEGTGYYQEKGKPILVIKEGDVIKVPANVEHWHGASHGSTLSHTAIVPAVPNSSTWMQPVPDSVYNTAREAVPGKKN